MPARTKAKSVKHRLRHRVKHLAKKRSLHFLFIALLLGSTAFFSKTQVANVQNASTPPRTTAVQAFDQTTLNALGLKVVESDEYALVVAKAQGTEGSSETVTYAANQDGEQLILTNSGHATVDRITGDTQSVIYVKADQPLFVGKKGEATSTTNQKKEKIDPAIEHRLKDNAFAPVIVRLHLPFELFYEKGQGSQKAQEKRKSFDEVKNRVVPAITGRGRIKDDLPIIGAVSADIDQQTLQTLSDNSDISTIELDREVQITLDTSLDQIHAKDVWNLVDTNGNSLTGVGKRIAILDTGVDYTHPDLGGCLGTGCKVVAGKDVYNNDTDPKDDHGHGTHVAATAAGKGILNGVAPDASIVAVKVLSAGGSGSSSQIISGINYVTDPNGDGNPSDHVDVASMSLGGSGNPGDAMSTAVNNSTAVGVVYTIAAGNSGPSFSTIMSPGTAQNAITVAASCKTSQIGSDSYCSIPIASFSSRGPLVYNGIDMYKPDVAAPGVLICAARFDNSFATSPTCKDANHVQISGTSMATPHVAGVAALILQAYPSYTPEQVKQTLKTSARSLGLSADIQGAGEVDVKAAIPLVPKVAANPPTWTILSSPSQKLSNVTQTFTVSTADPSINQLLVSFQIPTSGVSATSSKSTLNVGGGATDSFEATVTVDNDVAKLGTYLGKIIFSEAGTIKGLVSIFLTINPTFTVVPARLDYGIDNPELTSWTSDTKSFTITNLRTDSTQTVNITSAGLPAGTTLSTPTSVDVPAAGSSTLETHVSVDNTKVANGIYNGNLTLTTSANTASLALSFTKFYVLTVEDTNPADLTRAFPVAVHNRAGKSYFDHTNGSPRTFYLNEPGTYDIFVRYFFVYDPQLNKYTDFEVFKEGVTVSGGLTRVTVGKSEATNLVRTVPTDDTGGVANLLTRDVSYTYLPLPSSLPYRSTTFGGNTDYHQDVYTSAVGTNYRYIRTHQSIQPANKVFYYYGTFTGLTSGLSFTNTSGELKVMNVKWDLDQQTGSFQPLIWKGYGFYSVAYKSTTLTVPVSQTVYSIIPDTIANYFARPAAGSGYLFGTDVSSKFTVVTTPSRWTWYDNLYPPFSERTVYMGLGPTFWAGTFANNKTNIYLRPYFYPGYLVGNDVPTFLRQDYATKPYGSIPYTITSSDNQTYTGTIPQFPAGGTINNLPAGGPGKYEFTADFPYKNKGLDMVGQVLTSFDTALADPNPPTFKLLHVYTDTTRSEQYEPPVVNRVEFALDPVGGNLKDVLVSYSKDGFTFHYLTLNKNGDLYSANITPVSGIAKVKVRIQTTDDAGNSLAYTFELPVGAGSGLADTQAPSAAISQPPDGTQIQGNISVDGTVADNFGVERVELYVNNELISTNNAPTFFPFTWDATNSPYGTYTLVLKAYDEVGNVGISNPVNVVKPTPTPTPTITPSPTATPTPTITPTPTPTLTPTASPTPTKPGQGGKPPTKTPVPTAVITPSGDGIPPSLTITSPTDGSQVTRRSTIIITADASDDSGSVNVAFSVDGSFLCTDFSSPYTCDWNVPAKPSVTYTIKADATDPSGTSTSQSIQVISK